MGVVASCGRSSDVTSAARPQMVAVRQDPPHLEDRDKTTPHASAISSTALKSVTPTESRPSTTSSATLPAPCRYDCPAEFGDVYSTSSDTSFSDLQMLEEYESGHNFYMFYKLYVQREDAAREENKRASAVAKMFRLRQRERDATISGNTSPPSLTSLGDTMVPVDPEDFVQQLHTFVRQREATHPFVDSDGNLCHIYRTCRWHRLKPYRHRHASSSSVGLTTNCLSGPPLYGDPSVSVRTEERPLKPTVLSRFTGHSSSDDTCSISETFPIENGNPMTPVQLPIFVKKSSFLKRCSLSMSKRLLRASVQEARESVVDDSSFCSETDLRPQVHFADHTEYYHSRMPSTLFDNVHMPVLTVEVGIPTTKVPTSGNSTHRVVTVQPAATTEINRDGGGNHGKSKSRSKSR